MRFMEEKHIFKSIKNKVVQKVDAWDLQKNNVRTGIIIVIVALAFLGYGIYEYVDAKQQIEKKNEKDFYVDDDAGYTESDTSVVPDTDNVESYVTDENNQSSNLTESERSDDEIVSEQFVIEGLDDTALQMINQDQQGLSEALQESLYYNGYYNYTKAVVDEYYSKDNIVSINMSVTANEQLDIEAEYYLEDQSWYIRYW